MSVNKFVLAGAQFSNFGIGRNLRIGLCNQLTFFDGGCYFRMMQEATRNGLCVTGLSSSHDPSAVGVFADGIQRVAGLQIFFGKGANFSDRL